MYWRNQLTKTPYLVLFMILISIGVGTASALITITLAGDVHVTGDTTIDGELIVGADSSSNDDFIRFDGGNENIQWDESETRFRVSDSIVTGGHFAAGSISTDDTVNRFGDGVPQAPEDMTAPGDLYLADDLEVTDNLYVGGTVNCPTCLLGFYETEKEITLQPLTFGVNVDGTACDVGDDSISGGFDGPFQIEDSIHLSKSAKSSNNWAFTLSFDVAPAVEVPLILNVICADYAPVHVP